MSYDSNAFQYDCDLRFLKKDVNQNERDNYASWWKEQIQLYGTEVEYYTNSYNLSSHDALYGEEPTQVYAQPKKIVLALTLNENSVVLKIPSSGKKVTTVPVVSASPIISTPVCAIPLEYF